MIRVKLQITRILENSSTAQSTLDIAIDPEAEVKQTLEAHVPELNSPTHSVKVIYQGQALPVHQPWSRAFRRLLSEGSVLLIYVRPAGPPVTEVDMRPRQCRESALATSNILRVRRSAMGSSPSTALVAVWLLVGGGIAWQKFFHPQAVDPTFRSLLSLVMSLAVSAALLRLVRAFVSTT